MVGVAQLVEHWVVAPVVAGSIPVTHPITAITKEGVLDSLFYFCLNVPSLGAQYFNLYHICSLFIKTKFPKKEDLSKASFVEICEL